MKQSLFKLALASGVLFSAGLASADDSIRIGGSRAAGMGGAGIALPIDVVQNQRLNPAFLGYGKRKFGVQMPELGIRTRGIGIGDFQDVLGDIDEAGVSDEGVIRLARRFGDERAEAAADGSLGIVIANLSVSISGGANVTSTPNASLRGFIGAGREDYQNLPADARLDAYGYGFYQFAVGAGVPFKAGAGTMSVGGRVKAIKSYYGHKVADQTAIANGTGVRNGAEFGGGGDDTMSKSSVGFDLGVLYAPTALRNVFFGGTIDNLIKPKAGFTRTLPNSDVLTQTFNPFATVTTVGAGMAVRDNLLLAADVYDVFSEGIGKELRLGAELGVGHAAAVRAGYNSRTGFTLGASVLGFNFSIAGREPLIVSTNIRF